MYYFHLCVIYVYFEFILYLSIIVCAYMCMRVCVRAHAFGAGAGVPRQ